MSYDFDPASKQSVHAADNTTVPSTTPEKATRQSILRDWANVGLSADIMRPRSDDEQVWSAAVDESGDDWQQQSYCCR